MLFEKRGETVGVKISRTFCPHIAVYVLIYLIIEQRCVRARE